MNATDDASKCNRELPARKPEDIIGEKLIAYEVAGDESRFRMSFTCASGEWGPRSLTTECIQALTMTLPRMMTQALTARHGDESLRLDYPAETLRIEVAPDPNTLVLTITTPDGFFVSFSVTDQSIEITINC